MVSFTDEGKDIGQLLDTEHATYPEEDLRIAYVNIEGMTCSSCVKNIEGNISTISGVEKIEVSLEKKEGKIAFSFKETSGKALADAIDDMGFESTLTRMVNFQTLEEVPLLSEGQMASEENENAPETKSETVKIAVYGMTCQSCVKSIEGAVSKIKGVESVKVSLEGKEATIEYKPQFTNPVSLKNAIEDGGFEASLPSSGTPANETELRSTCINIEGMTCNSCVQSIEKNIGELDGVNSISVSLTNKKADISYYPEKVSVEQLREAIDDMGFEAALHSGSISTANEVSKTAVIGVEGMTCMSCVKSIEGEICTKPGVKDIKVSLPNKQATVEYDPSITTSEDVRGAIEDMGFEASLSSEGNTIRFAVVRVMYVQ